jgi:hypothetical protein
MSTLAEELVEVRRIHAVAVDAYPLLVARRAMTAADATDRLWRLKGALERLEELGAMPELAAAVEARIVAKRTGEVADVKREIALGLVVDAARGAGA